MPTSSIILSISSTVSKFKYFKAVLYFWLRSETTLRCRPKIHVTWTKNDLTEKQENYIIKTGLWLIKSASYIHRVRKNTVRFLMMGRLILWRKPQEHHALGHTASNKIRAGILCFRASWMTTEKTSKSQVFLFLDCDYLYITWPLRQMKTSLHKRCCLQMISFNLYAIVTTDM